MLRRVIGEIERKQVRKDVPEFRAGDTVAVGDHITPTTSGYLIKCNSGFVSVGECMVAASSGGFGSTLLRGKYYVASL